MTGTATHVYDWQERHYNLQSRLRIEETWDDAVNSSDFVFFLDLKADNPPINDNFRVNLRLSYNGASLAAFDGTYPGTTIRGDWTQLMQLGSLSGVQHSSDGSLTLPILVEAGATTRVCRVACASYTSWKSEILQGTINIACHTIQTGLCHIAYGGSFIPAAAYVAINGQFVKVLPYIAFGGSWLKGV